MQKNTKMKHTIWGNRLTMAAYRPETVYDHVMRRMKEIEKKGYKKKLVFHAPTCLKYQGRYLSEFQTGSGGCGDASGYDRSGGQ